MRSGSLGCRNSTNAHCAPYLGGGGVKISRLRPGSGLGFGFGAFLVSLRPLSLLPMGTRMPQKFPLAK